MAFDKRSLQYCRRNVNIIAFLLSRFWQIGKYWVLGFFIRKFFFTPNEREKKMRFLLSMEEKLLKMLSRYNMRNGLHSVCNQLLCTQSIIIRYALKKNYGIIWEFFPPIPPFWEPLIRKKIYRLFCILGL